MKTRRRRKKPEILLRDGEPAAVILEIADYEELLECAEDAEDLRWLKEMQDKPKNFRKLSDVLAEFERV